MASRPDKPCVKCLRYFTPNQRGRERRVCYDCKPANKQTAQDVQSAKAEGINPDAPHVEIDGKCAFCRAYLPKGQKFCNPNHRAQFQELIANRGKGRHKADNVGTRGPRMRPIEIVRQLRKQEVVA